MKMRGKVYEARDSQECFQPLTEKRLVYLRTWGYYSLLTGIRTWKHRMSVINAQGLTLPENNNKAGTHPWMPALLMLLTRG